jgi:hypothetical protein
MLKLLKYGLKLIQKIVFYLSLMRKLVLAIMMCGQIGIVYANTNFSEIHVYAQEEEMLEPFNDESLTRTMPEPPTTPAPAAPQGSSELIPE